MQKGYELRNIELYQSYSDLIISLAYLEISPLLLLIMFECTNCPTHILLEIFF